MSEKRGGAAGPQGLCQQPVVAGLGDAGFFICFNVPKGFVSEVPHCSRDLELTGTASSFISLGQDAELGGMERQLCWGREAATPVCVHGGRVVRRRRRKGQGGSKRSPPRCVSGPAPGTSSRLGHEKDPQLPAVALTKRTFVKRVSFNFACKKIILHIFCTSLTVPIEPGPCRFAEESGHDFPRTQPDPKEGGGSRKRRRELRSREGGRGGAAASPRSPAAACRHRPPSPKFQPRSPPAARQPPAGKGQPALDTARWC